MSVEFAQILTSLLGPLALEEQAWLEERVVLRRYPPGFAVFHEGLAPREMAVLLEGRLRISKLRPDKRQENIAYVEPVALLGLAAVIGGIPYPTTAMAREASTCLLLPGRLLEPGDDPMGRRLALRLLKASLRGMNAQLRAANARLYGLAGERELVDALAADLGAWSLPVEP